MSNEPWWAIAVHYVAASRELLLGEEEVAHARGILRNMLIAWVVELVEETRFQEFGDSHLGCSWVCRTSVVEDLAV